MRIRSRHLYNWGIWGLFRFQDGTPQSCYVEPPSPLDWVFRGCFLHEACLWRLGLPSHHLETQRGRLCQGEDTETSYGFCWGPRSEIGWWAFVVRYFCLQIGRDNQNTPRELVKEAKGDTNKGWVYLRFLNVFEAWFMFVWIWYDCTMLMITIH